MNYLLERIGTVQACNTLLARVQRKKQRLERQRRNLGASVNTFRERTDQISMEFAVMQSSRVAFATAHDAFPEGKDKARMMVKGKQLEVDLLLLEKKAGTYNVHSLLASEVKCIGLDSQLLVIEHYITAVENRKSMLSEPVLRQTDASLRAPVAKRSPRIKKKKPQLKKTTLPVSSSAVAGPSLKSYLDEIERWLGMPDRLSAVSPVPEFLPVLSAHYTETYFIFDRVMLVQNGIVEKEYNGIMIMSTPPFPGLRAHEQYIDLKHKHFCSTGRGEAISIRTGWPADSKPAHQEFMVHSLEDFSLIGILSGLPIPGDATQMYIEDASDSSHRGNYKDGLPTPTYPLSNSR